MGLILNSTTTNAGGGGLTIEEADGTPSIAGTTVLKFPNNSLTVVGTTVSVDEYPAPAGIDGPTLTALMPFLKAGWTFNDAGAPIDDSVGVNYQLALGAGSPSFLQAGKNGTAVLCDASNNFNRPDYGFGPGVGEFTLNSWIYLTNYSGTEPMFFKWYKDSTHSIALYVRNNGELTLFSYNGGYQYQHLGSFASYLNKWTMLTWVKTYNSGTGAYNFEIYLDGAFFASWDHANIIDDLNGFDFQIAPQTGGQLTQDEVLYYRTALSPAAIAELWNSGTGKFLTTIGAPSGLGFSHADLVGYNSHLHDYWKFEESGTPLIDAISNNSLAATGSPTFGATGKNNNCLDFNSATPDYLSRTSTFAHTTTQEYTLSYWVYVDALGAIQHFHQFYTPASSAIVEQVHIGTAGELYNYRKWNTGASNQVITAPTTFTAATWHHIVVVKAQVGAAYQWSLYLDGAHQGSDTANTNSTSQNTATSTFYVGKTADASPYELDGKIDELAYWKGTALNSAAITALYNAGAGRFLESI